MLLKMTCMKTMKHNSTHVWDMAYLLGLSCTDLTADWSESLSRHTDAATPDAVGQYSS